SSTLTPPPPRPTLFPYTTLFRSSFSRSDSSSVSQLPASVGGPSKTLLRGLHRVLGLADKNVLPAWPGNRTLDQQQVFVGVHFHNLQILGRHLDRKSTRLNSSH